MGGHPWCVYSPAQTVQCVLNVTARPIILGHQQKTFTLSLQKRCGQHAH